MQNRVATALPRLPADVRNIGVTVAKASSDLMMVVHVLSPDKSRDPLFISNYAAARDQGRADARRRRRLDRRVRRRDYSMRVWLDPDRLQSLGMTANDVTAALQGQNIQVASGILNQPPVDQPGAFQVSVQTLGRLADPEQFANIVVKQTANAVVRLKDIGRGPSCPVSTIRRTPISISIRRSRSRCSSAPGRTRSPPPRTSARPWWKRPSGFRRG